MLRGQAITGSTSLKYRRHWLQWCRFSRLMQWSEWMNSDTNSSNTKLGLFAIYCWRYGWNEQGNGNQFGTIQLKLSSIRWYHRRYLGLQLSASPTFEILMRGIKRLSEPVSKKQPISPAFLRLLYRRLDFAHPRSRLLWGSVLLAYLFLLRRSEYLRIGSHRHTHCLKSANAFFSDTQGVSTSGQAATSVTIGLAGCKNDQYGRGAWRTMHATGDSLLCPIEALKHINKARQDLRCGANMYLCANLDASEVAQSFKSLASSIGVPRDNYSTHSIRIGGARAFLNGKADSLSIKLLGRWMSHCFEEYPVLAAQATVDLTRRMI